MNYSPAESLQLYVQVCRIFDAVSCTYTGDAKSEVYGMLGWLKKVGPRDDPELQPLLDAIEHSWKSYTPWESRCQLLSQTIQPLETRVLTLFADGTMG